jgi:hypothetical protein
VATWERSLLGEVSLSSAALEILRLKVHVRHLQEMCLTGNTFKFIFPISELFFKFSEISLIYFKQELQGSFCHPSKATYYSCHIGISFLLSVIFGKNVLLEK